MSFIVTITLVSLFQHTPWYLLSNIWHLQAKYRSWTYILHLIFDNWYHLYWLFDIWHSNIHPASSSPWSSCLSILSLMSLMGVVNEVSQGNHYASHIALTQICICLAIFLAHTALTHICIFLTHILFHILAKEIIMRHICSYTYLHFSLANICQGEPR